MKRLLKTLVLQWLDERALRLPHATKQKLADRLKVDASVIEAVETEFREHVIKMLREV